MEIGSVASEALKRVWAAAGWREWAWPRGGDAGRLADAVLIEQCDEWLVARRYLSEESLALVLEDQGDEEREEEPQLQTG